MVHVLLLILLLLPIWLGDAGGEKSLHVTTTAIASNILERNPGGLIIYDVKCSRFLDGIIREHGGSHLRAVSLFRRLLAVRRAAFDRPLSSGSSSSPPR